MILADSATITVSKGGNLTMQSKYGFQNSDHTNVSIVNNGDFYCSPTATNNYVSQLGVPFNNTGTQPLPNSACVLVH